MAQPYVGEIRLFAGNFAIAGWQFCDGTLLPISEYETLFNLIGTTYGGDGQNTFGVPDLRGRVPLHLGNNFVIGEMGGVEQVTLTTQQMPVHNHALIASTDVGNNVSPASSLLATTSTFDRYVDSAPSGTMAANSIGLAGGSQPHDNMQPFVCINYIISLFGLYPSPT